MEPPGTAELISSSISLLFTSPDGKKKKGYVIATPKLHANKK